jgi:tetratricopeptide (TPR) repeat protein
MSGAAHHPPSPYGVGDLDELVTRLRRLHIWAGLPYRELHRGVVRERRRRGVAELPTYNTVYRCFQPGRTRLDVELLVDIARVLLGDDGLAAEWRQAHQAIVGEAAWASVVNVSNQLPADLPGFVGRQAELDTLLVASDAGGAVVVALDGMAGVGKTQLAVHAAHLLQRQGRYVDLQLAVNLRGFDAELPPADPAAVLDALLRHLGMAGAQIHGLSLAERSERFRALMADRKALLLLDNAATEDQVAPLLPYSSTSHVLITSRRRLVGLAGVNNVSLGVLTEVESLDLLRATAGEVIAASPIAADIARMAGHLPLALALAGSRMRNRPHWTLADHMDQLAEHASRLRLDDRVDVALRLSYAALSPDQQRLLRRLALHPGRDIEATAVAALAGCDLEDAVRHLAELQASNVVSQRSPGRYELHDLVRLFAAGCARDEDPGTARRAALTRLADHYRYAAALAVDLYAPHEKHRRPAVIDPGTSMPPLSDRAAATAWLEAERANLMSVAAHAAEQKWSTYIGEIATILYAFLDLSGYHRDAELLHGRAAEIAHGRARGFALTQLGTVYWRTGRMSEAIECFQRGERLFEQIGDVAGRARVIGNLGVVFQGTGRYAEALERDQVAARLFHQAADSTGESRIYGNAGCVRVGLGQYVEAQADFERSLELARQVGDQAGAGATLANLGCCHEKLGNYAEALDYHQQALAIACEVGHHDGQAQSMSNIGTALAYLGRLGPALRHEEQALRMAQASGARQVEAKAYNGGGVALRLLGRNDDALDWLGNALRVAEDLGDREEIARAHAELGATWADRDTAAEARRHWQAALTLYRGMGAPEAEEIAAAIRGLDASH